MRKPGYSNFGGGGLFAPMGSPRPKSRKRKTALLPRATNDARTVQISDRHKAVLRSLAAYEGWARPMDVGGRDGSHHSATLNQLARHGLAERKKYHAIYCYHGSTSRQKLVDNRWVVTHGHPPTTKCCCKGSCRYKITAAGQEAIHQCCGAVL